MGLYNTVVSQRLLSASTLSSQQFVNIFLKKLKPINGALLAMLFAVPRQISRVLEFHFMRVNYMFQKLKKPKNRKPKSTVVVCTQALCYYIN